MATVIRMQRAGSRNHPTYRVVVCDSRMRRDGRFIEKVGHYDPRHKPVLLALDAERIRYWVEKGAQPSESVAALLKHQEKGTVGELTHQP
jgi:small subunit ribosomal protein S16